MGLKHLLLATTLLAATGAEAQELTVLDWKYSDPVTQGYYDSAKAAFEVAHPGATVNFVAQPALLHKSREGVISCLQRGSCGA